VQAEYAERVANAAKEKEQSAADKVEEPALKQ
jgi:hypothetical protein